MAAMVTAWVDQLRDSFEGSIDFEGQKKAEIYTQWILISSAVIGFAVGFALQNLLVTLGIFGAGFVTALAVVVPPWPMFNEHPIAWLPADHKGDTMQAAAHDSETRKKR